ncbi:MAG: N-acetylmuramoyl-L-alanine amidase [Clostridia bacterium]|nr:N-acetylmuramoyl-L-alanine amidase [Clostridia bacterium]
MRRSIMERLIPIQAAACIGAVVILSAFAFFLATRAVMVLAPLRDVVCGRTVAIDAGHGGPDSGARGKTGIKEKEINLHIATELRTMLNRVAVYTVMTRDDDHDLMGNGENNSNPDKRAELAKRAALVNAEKPDIFVTIHSNAFPEPQWSGAQTFYNPVSEESRKLAEHIQAELVRRLGPNTRRARPADMYLLRKVAAPSALVEVGFLSNPREERLLSDHAYRVRVADAIHHGIVAYLMTAADKAASAPDGAGVGDEWGLVHKVGVDGPVDIGGTEDAEGVLGAPSAAGAHNAPVQVTPDSMVLYFGGPTNFEDSLMPEVREIPGLRSMERTRALSAAMGALIAGPGRESILQPTIPKGTVLRSVRLQGDTAFVDLGAEFVANHWGGSRGEELTIYSIVNTMTEFPYVKKVVLLVEGKLLDTISGHVEIEGPLERNQSIVHFRS